MSARRDLHVEAMERLDAIAREVIPFEQYGRFMRSVRGFRIFYQFASKEGPPADPKKLASDIEALERVVGLLDPVSDAGVVDALRQRLEATRRRLAVKSNQRTTKELKDIVTGDVLGAISTAYGVHVGRLSVGQNPDTGPASCDLPLVIVALTAIGVSESENGVYKRVGRMIREAQADANFDERHGVAFARSPETLEGKDHVAF